MNITKADIINTIDTIFGFFEINITAIIEIIENSIETKPPPIAESTLKPAPKNNAAVAPISVKIPPIIPKTNSPVLDVDCCSVIFLSPNYMINFLFFYICYNML